MLTLPEVERIKAFVIAGHGDITMVKQMLAEEPALLLTAHDWGGFPGDTETALQAAAHVGNQEIARFLLGQGAPMEITTAAMLGDAASVKHFLAQDPGLIKARGAHRISLLAHAVYSMDVDLLEILHTQGADMDPSALFAPVTAGRTEVVRWLLENGAADLTIRDFRGRTPLQAAQTANQPRIEALLKEWAGGSNHTK